MHTTKRLAGILIALFFLQACAGLSGKPDWIAHPPKDPAHLTFIGISSGASSLAEGQDGAIKNAMSQISDFMGTRVQSIMEQNVTEMEQRLKHQIHSKSKARVQGAHVKDWYYEERDSKYDVYVLIKFPKVQVVKELARQKHENEEKAHAALDLYVKGEEKEQQRNYKEAKNLYIQAQDLLKDVGELVDFYKNEKITTSKMLETVLETRIQTSTAAMRRLTYTITVAGPESYANAFASSLSTQLAGNDFTISREEAAYEISGTVSVAESGYVMKNFVYYAEGSLSAFRVSDGQVIGTVPFKVKGFGLDKDKASIKALAAAGEEAGQNLVIILLSNE